MAFLRRVRDWVGAIAESPLLYPFGLLCMIDALLHSDMNLLAPNLTAIAKDFNNMTQNERDLMLGGVVSLAFYLTGGAGVVVIGYLTDMVNRRNFFSMLVFVGEISCLCTLAVTTFDGLLATRCITSVAIVGVRPLIFSLVGDLFEPALRSRVLGFLGILQMVGIVVGQTLAGTIGSVFGWRVPFAVVAVPALVLAPIFRFTTVEPTRGTKDLAAVGGGLHHHHHYGEELTLAKVWSLLRHNRTAALIIASKLPGNIPWSVVLVFFQDWIVQDLGPRCCGPEGITVSQSTLVVITFAFGGGLGLAAGGYIIDRMWERPEKPGASKHDRGRIPMLMGALNWVAPSLLLIPINVLLPSLGAICACAFPAGFFALLPGQPMNAVMMNVVLPEVRGTAMSLAMLLDYIGSAIGPIVIAGIIVEHGREYAFSVSMTGWYVSGLLLCMAAPFVERDVARHEDAMRIVGDRVHRAALGGGAVAVLPKTGSDAETAADIVPS